MICDFDEQLGKCSACGRLAPPVDTPKPWIAHCPKPIPPAIEPHSFAPVTICKYRGEPTGTVQCPTCPTPAPMTVFDCQIYVSCTRDVPVEGCGCCRVGAAEQCRSYVAKEI